MSTFSSTPLQSSYGGSCSNDDNRVARTTKRIARHATASRHQRLQSEAPQRHVRHCIPEGRGDAQPLAVAVSPRAGRPTPRSASAACGGASLCREPGDRMDCDRTRGGRRVCPDEGRRQELSIAADPRHRGQHRGSCPGYRGATGGAATCRKPRPADRG